MTRGPWGRARAPAVPVATAAPMAPGWDDPAAAHRFPCGTCGSAMRFDARGGLLKCDHCGNTEPIAQRDATPAIVEIDFAAAVSQRLPQAQMEETRVSACPNCGAQVDLGPDTHATECPFCATPVVAGTGIHRHIKPAALLPFALDEPAAREAMNEWLGSLWFAPNGLTAYARRGRRMQGIYVPYWTFDADTRSAYRGERGTVYYVTQTVVRNGKRQQIQVPRVRWRPVAGRVRRFFDDVLVLASTSLPKRFTDALEPWDLSGLAPYTPDYIAGFRAEGYNVGLEDGFVEARQRMDAAIARDVRFDIGGDRQRIHTVETDVSDVTFKHVLLPIWLAAYKYRGATYRFVVNGQSGRVQGERPWSTLKIALAVIVGLIAAGVVAFVASQGG